VAESAEGALSRKRVYPAGIFALLSSWGIIHRGDAETQRKTKSKPESAEVAESAEGGAVAA
jgi:predicted deacylase